MRRTKEDAEKTRLKIIEAALILFSRNGYSNTTLAMIGTEAGYSRGPIYWHFKNKGDLFMALVQRVRMPFQSLMEEVSNADPTVSPLDAIRLACHAGLNRLEQPSHQRILSILLHRCEFFSDINPIEMQDEIAEECFDEMLLVFQLAQQQQLLRDDITPEIATRLMQSTLGGLFHDWLRNPDAFSLRERGGVLIDALMAMLHR